MWYFVLFFGVLFADQITKYLVDTAGRVHELIPDIFAITPARNEYAAFSMLRGNDWAPTFFLIVSIIMIVAFIVLLFMQKKRNRWFYIAVSLVLSGAVGNLIDRIFIGAVRDFIDVKFFANFNIADIGVCVGVGMLMVFYLFMDEYALFKKNAVETDASNTDDISVGEKTVESIETESALSQTENADDSVSLATDGDKNAETDGNK